MRYRRRLELRTVENLEEIPAFASEDDEREWWAGHELSPSLYAQLEVITHPGVRPAYRLKVSVDTPTT